MSDYNLIVIGAGPGGYTAALRASKLGLKTAVVEEREAGGTCLNRGCVPTKTLLHSSKAYREARDGAEAGIVADGIRMDLENLFAYKNKITSTLSQGVEGLLKSAKVDLIRGKGKIEDPGKVSVTGTKGEGEGDRVITSDNILIATGSVPARPPIPGLDLTGVMTSDELLSGIDRLFNSITVIGGGVIGVEFATFFSDLGCKVTILEGLERLLPPIDREIGQNLSLILKKAGVEIHTGAMVESLEETEDGVKVNFTEKGESASVVSEKVLCAIGRSPFRDGLFDEELGVEMEGRRIRVDEDFRTSVPGIYAIGDVSSRIQLAHVASAQGTACVEKIAGAEPTVDLSIVPSCIYSNPEIAVVGMTDAEAKEKGLAVKVGKCVMGGNARTMIAEPGRSFMKVVAEQESGKILGAQLMCVNATDMISQISEAIANGLTAADLLKAMRPHPTFEEALSEALEDLVAKLEK